MLEEKFQPKKVNYAHENTRNEKNKIKKTKLSDQQNQRKAANSHTHTHKHSPPSLSTITSPGIKNLWSQFLNEKTNINRTDAITGSIFLLDLRNKLQQQG